jgi:hypothetical protein
LDGSGLGGDSETGRAGKLRSRLELLTELGERVFPL